MKKKRILAFALAAAMVITGSQAVFAAPSSAKLKAANEQVSSLKSKTSSIQSQLNGLDKDLSDVLVNISIIEKDLAAKKAEIAQTKADLAKAQKDEQDQYNAMKKRIRYLYENGQTSYLTTFLEAKNFGDALNKVSYASQVYSSDREMLTEYQAAVKKVNTLLKKVEEEEAELEETQDSYNHEKATLKTTIKKKKSQLSGFNSQLAKAKTLAAKYAEAVQEEEAAERAAAQKAAARKAAAQKAAKASASSSSSDRENVSSGGSSGSSSDSENISSGGSSSSSSRSGSAVVSYGAQFVGNRYVWGGSSLTNGADCSGFVMAVYAHFGVSLPHSSSALRGVGRGVSQSDMQPGDIVCYAGHVGIYAGGGQLLNASNSAPYPRGGIKYTNVHYRTILAVRRIF
ncbi:MAG: NlpC/P60 family protein [Lachnospiraceae bacterium]|jgi:peptidoglycan hydrolase CwlO-like protein|nr:NlpC/P60 family protein [Lachnospiraceae bacterium]MCI1657686.1 NlpC/P60 family protein [Lachnospiraceae bacterium]MCI2196102.1 NlpC/P60 family protein [Lachnospiraceae bacterium]